MIRLSVVLVLALCAACGVFSHRPPSPLAGYRILVESRDLMSEYLAGALKQKGFTVRRRVAGGSRATAALIMFTFRDEPPSQRDWLALRLADTRSGAVLAAVSVPLDALAPRPAARARQLAESLTARLSPP